MIEPPRDLSDATIVARVRERYGIDAANATFLPVGNDSSAWSYRLDGGDRWFLKVFGRPVNAAAVEVPRLLAAIGLDHLIPAIPTIDGDAFDTGEPFSFVLLPYVEARPGAEVGLTAAARTELGRFLRAVHDTRSGGDLIALMRHERFDVRDEAYIERAAGQLDDAERADPVTATLLQTWRERRDDIAHALQRCRELAAYGRSAGHERVICHADFHAWNVLVGPSGALHVVDWDEVVFAPRERDLMFISGDIADLDPTGEAFYAGYGDVVIDAALLAYYRWDWVLQEVADYHRRVFDDALGAQTRAEAVEYFVELFDPDGVVAAAYRADAEIR